MTQIKSLRTGIKFKDTPIGKIPVDWEATTIENVCDILDGKRVPLNKEQRDKMKGDIPYYGANGVVDHINDYIFDEDLILLAEDGGYSDEHQTRPIAYLIHGKSWVNNHAHVLKVREQAIIEWIFYSLVHKNVMPFIKGGTRSTLNQGDLRQIPITLPSLSEQKKIADILTTVDDAIEETDRIIEKTKELKKGLMQKLLTHGIGHKKFKKTGIGEIPAEWEVSNIEGVASKEKNAIKAGLFGCVVPKEVEPGIINPRLIKITLNTNKVLPSFFKYLMSSDLMQNQMANYTHGLTMGILNTKTLKMLALPIPSLKEQNQITVILSEIDAEISYERNHKEQLESLKKSLMQVLLTGRVRVKLHYGMSVNSIPEYSGFS